MITFEDEPFKNSFDDDLKGLPLDSEHSKILDRIPDILTPGLLHIYFNRSFRRKRGKASNPLFIIHTRLFFPINFAMATLDLKKMGKFL